MFENLIESLNATHVVIAWVSYFIYKAYTYYLEINKEQNIKRDGYIPVPEHIRYAVETTDVLAKGTAKVVDSLLDRLFPNSETDHKTTVKLTPPKADEVLKKIDSMKDDVDVEFDELEL